MDGYVPRSEPLISANCSIPNARTTELGRENARRQERSLRRTLRVAKVQRRLTPIEIAIRRTHEGRIPIGIAVHAGAVVPGCPAEALDEEAYGGRNEIAVGGEESAVCEAAVAVAGVRVSKGGFGSEE